MEQPPGSLEDLQPQDLSTSSIPTVIDLTRKGEECVLNATSLDALRMVKSPGWYPNSGTPNSGLAFPETSDITLQSGDQLQPENAFSHTTVTLSYVSRSRVYATNDTLSRHSPRYGTVSKLSALRPPRDSDRGLGESGYALNQQCVEQVDPAAQTERFQSVSQAQVGPENDGGVRPTREPREFNGAVSPSDGDVYKHVEGEEENGKGLENGQGDRWSGSGVTGEGRGDSEVLFLTSKEQDPVLVPDGVGDQDLCSLSRQYISPLEDPVSPSTTSQDDMDDVFVLPQASSSPSGDNSYLETTDVVAWDGSGTVGDVQPGSGFSDSTTRSDSSDENRRPVHRRKAALEPLSDLKGDVCVSDVSEKKPKTVVPHMNGNSKALRRTLKEKKLPVRSGRGTRLEAIVMNINSSKYKVSGCIRTNKKAKDSQSAASVSKSANPKRNETLSVGQRKGKDKAKVSFSAKTTKQKAASPLTRGKPNHINTDRCKDSTSDSDISNSKNSHSSTAPKSPEFAVHQNSKEELKHVSQPDPSAETHLAPSSPPSQSPKKSPAKGKASGSKPAPGAKTRGARTPKRRRKKHKPSQSSSMFAPKEPEIKLKYVNYKEEKKELRLDSFSPFIRVERRQVSPSLCTVINYPEEVRTQHRKGQQQQQQQQQQAHPGSFISAAVPSTSCLQLGRVSTHSQHQRALVCCLCGWSANAMDLGDLHGPYYPEGYQPSTKTPASTSGLKEDEDDYSDSDSSSCSMKGRGRKRAVLPASRPPRPRAQLEGRRWSVDSTGSPAAKRARSGAGSADGEDWYSPPVLPLEPCEHWLHEECSIWSAGVFLVKGKVYGLEEAVKVAQETTCSACQDSGATLGCVFKGCPNKYHYRCALDSDCVLIEENFSMKCKKHKNKTFKALPGNRWDDR